MSHYRENQNLVTYHRFPAFQSNSIQVVWLAKARARLRTVIMEKKKEEEYDFLAGRKDQVCVCDQKLLQQVHFYTWNQRKITKIITYGLNRKMSDHIEWLYEPLVHTNLQRLLFVFDYRVVFCLLVFKQINSITSSLSVVYSSIEILLIPLSLFFKMRSLMHACVLDDTYKLHCEWEWTGMYSHTHTRIHSRCQGSS